MPAHRSQADSGSIRCAAVVGQALPRSRRSRLAKLCLWGLVAAATPACSAFTDDESLDPEATRARFEAQGRDTVGGPRVSELVGTTPKRTRTAAAMLFDIGGAPNKTSVTNLLSGPGTSLTRMYNEISYGIQQVQVDIFGPYTLPVKNCLTIACCGPSSDRTGNGATVQGLIDALPMKYDHYFWDYGPLPAGADCGTWGDEGTPASPAKYSSYSFQGIVGQAQELGHNLGMTHEPTLKCTGAKPFLDYTSQCTHVEYGSSLSFMGGGARHPSAYHKYAQGWIGKCNVVTTGASGTFNLVPQELPCDGVQLLKIAAPKVRPAPAKGDRQGSGPMLSNYYLEMRAPIGFDSGLKPMVVISIGADLPSTTRSAPYLYVLDMTPEASGRADLTNAGLLTVGQSYEDPAGGLTITLMAISAQSATVNVTTTATGDAKCSDNTAFTPPGMDYSSCVPLAGADGGVSATGGATGSGGASAGTGGRGGSGQPGTGGSSAGSGGARASGGAGVATGGRPGSGGAVVTGTGGVTAGSGGAPATGSGGASSAVDASVPGATGGQGAPGATTDAVSGCGCSTSAGSGRRGGSLFSMVGLSLSLAVVLARRRRSRPGSTGR